MIDNKRLSGFVFQCIAEFGCESQIDILQEECAELIQACSKAKRGYPDSKERLIEEIAHVLVSSSVVAQIYAINEDDIVNEINKKADKYGFCRVKGVNKMNKEERPTMPGIVAMTKYLVGIWHESKCPSILLSVDCCECKYRYLCSKLDELSKVIDNDYL